MADHDRLAVLIDADNTTAKFLPRLVVEIAKYGRASVRRAYGDWTSPQLGSWKAELLTNSIQPIQQFSYTTGKNATDSAMIIDAMDLLYAGNLDGFCIVSSDSDFTRLAARIREQGLTVYGFGQRKTPQPFRAACDTFVYLENLAEEALPDEEETKPDFKPDQRLNRLLGEALDAASGDDGWATLSVLGSNLSRLASDFDPRTWGYGKLKDLMADHPDYLVQSRPTKDGKNPVVQVRRRSRRRTSAKS
ncbi:MAG: NYN domain-containing protein [Actinomycetota bacterium]